ncbi:MAG: DUF6290 family protein [Phascolarctobacterium sp.]|uniref:type II toxin-antitoxin system RelB family antitoxin n=1 Tax=Phascolarctobacterium sp. TaxID=2049039 RepID=UPI0026DBB74E|nr:DUF6290 family protein [Phascolarctobacterium sp.]MDO4920918.1 DUF6290 family protein [Phascolarctobacterium sp.]
MTTISVRLNDQDSEFIKKYAEFKNISISELIRQAVIERIEDEIDIRAYNKAMEEYRKNPVTYTLDEIEKELGLE